jgi:hypothetical protein
MCTHKHIIIIIIIITTTTTTITTTWWKAVSPIFGAEKQVSQLRGSTCINYKWVEMDCSGAYLYRSGMRGMRNEVSFMFCIAKTCA